jgi:signal transduction histidine kinase
MSAAGNVAFMFNQTGCFVLLCLVAMITVSWLVYRWRIRRIMERMDHQFQARLAERIRIAQELHDTLLQGFVSASIQLHVVADAMPADSPYRPKLIEIGDLIRQVLEEGREAVAGLRAPQSGLDFLERAFSRIPDDLGIPTPVDFRVVVEGKPRPLQPPVRDEVYRIGREALMNSFRHSKATRIEAAIEYRDRSFRLLVRDNGAGIDPRVLSHGRTGHWGMPGMLERAQRIGGQFKVWSRGGAGTEVELTIPGYVAFGLEHPSRRMNRLRRLLLRR